MQEPGTLPVFAVNTGQKVVLPQGVDYKQQQQQDRQQVLLANRAVGEPGSNEEAGKIQSFLEYTAPT